MTTISIEDAQAKLPELIGGLASDISTLFRKEIELAKAETSEKVSQVTSALVLLGVGGVLGLGALVVILAAIVTALAAFFIGQGMGATAANSLSAAIVGGDPARLPGDRTGRSRLRRPQAVRVSC